jgi:thioredoxin-like negative regulator of GroEL
MAKKRPQERTRLTLDLPGELAERLKLAAARQNRAASDVAIELLSKCLPRVETRETGKPRKIPYT